MIDFATLSAAEILAIPNNRPDKLFDPVDIITQHRKLKSRWHPDRNKSPDATKVFQHLNELKEIALEQLGMGTWVGPNKILFYTKDKKKMVFKYRRFHEIEVGKLYIGYNTLMYVIDQNFTPLFDNATKRLGAIHYPLAKFKDEFTRYLPEVVFSEADCSIGHVFVMKKTEDVILLQDLIDHLGGKIPPKHVAWIVSSLMNTACFLNHIDLNHNGLTTTNVFVSPQYHSCCIFGGWWYSSTVNGRLLALPRELINKLPASVLTDKVSKVEHNLIGLFTLALACLGDTSGTGSKLLTNSDIPAEFLAHLQNYPSNDVIDEYGKWRRTLEKVWGPRKFINLDVKSSDIY